MSYKEKSGVTNKQQMGGAAQASSKANYLDSAYAHKKNVTSYDYKLLKYIFQLGGIDPQGNVLDLACGLGNFKSVFESYNFHYDGVDIDNEDLDRNIVRADVGADTLPYPDEYFDLVFFKMVIEHLSLQEIAHCLSEARRVLKSNGKLIVITPDWKWTHQVFYEEYTHQTPFTSESLNTALKMANYECDLCSSFIQLPIVWRFPMLKIVCDIASLLYPITEKSFKFVKFSKIRALVAIAHKVRDLP